MPRIAGVANGALVLCDTPVATMSFDDLQTSPETQGGRHRESRQRVRAPCAGLVHRLLVDRRDGR